MTMTIIHTSDYSLRRDIKFHLTSNQSNSKFWGFGFLGSPSNEVWFLKLNICILFKRKLPEIFGLNNGHIRQFFVAAKIKIFIFFLNVFKCIYEPEPVTQSVKPKVWHKISVYTRIWPYTGQCIFRLKTCESSCHTMGLSKTLRDL